MALIKQFLPILDTFQNFSFENFRCDLWAGLTVGTILIPQGMAYAMLAGMPPIYGLYAGLIPLLIYAFFASSTRLSLGPVAVSALLVLAGVSQIAEPFSAQYISLVITTGLLVGIAQVLMSFIRLGFLVNFLSHPVISGFTSAAAIIIVISQLGDGLGIKIPKFSHSLDTLKYAIAHINQVHLISAALCIGSIVIMLICKKISKKIPGPLLVVTLGIALSYFLKLENLGVDIIKDVPNGLPAFEWPQLNREIISQLLPVVLAVTIIGIVESIGIAKALENKHKDHTVRPNQELFALGIAKILGSFFQAIPTSGSFSRSAINSDNNAKSTLSSLVSVMLVALTLLFFTSVFYHLPKSVLAAIILLAVLSLFDYKEAKFLWYAHKQDFTMMMVTFFATLIFGIEEGVFAGVILSILLVLYRSARPQAVELGNIPGTEFYKDIDRFKQAECSDNAIIMRFDDQLYFGNAAFLKEQINTLINKRPTKPKYFILDGSNINDIDSSGLHVLKDIDLELKANGIDLHLCGAIGPVRDRLKLGNLLNEEDKHHMAVHSCVNFINTNEYSDNKIICRPSNPMQTNI